MGKFVLCSSLLEGCASDPGLFSDVLFEFPKDNQLAVCIDSPDGLIIKSYQSVAAKDKNNLIGTWLYCMINRSALAFEDLSTPLSTDRLRFFEMALVMGGEAPLVVWSKSQWTDAIAQMPDAWVLDRIEGRRAVRRSAKGKEIKRMGAKKPAGGSVVVTGHVVNVGNINSDNSKAAVNSGSGRAILELEDALGASHSPEVIAELRKLQDQLRSPTPDKGVVEGTWKKLVALAPSITSIASAVTAVAGIVGHP